MYTDTPRSESSQLLYNKLTTQLPESKIVVRPGDNGTLLWHACTDIDVGLKKVIINPKDWNGFQYCDYKLYKNISSAQVISLNKFLSNPQPFKILHISLDQRKANAFDLLKQLGDLKWSGELSIEINDRTETLTSLDEIRKITDFFPIDEILCLEYLNAKYDKPEAFWVDLKDPNSQIVYYTRLVITH